MFLSKETNGSPVFSQDREIAVVNDENNNEVTKDDECGSEGTNRESDTAVEVVVATTEEDVCENVNVREMRKFFIEQGRQFAIRVRLLKTFFICFIGWLIRLFPRFY